MHDRQTDRQTDGHTETERERKRERCRVINSKRPGQPLLYSDKKRTRSMHSCTREHSERHLLTERALRQHSLVVSSRALDWIGLSIEFNAPPDTV